ncbi:MAG: GldG family protein, partial [Acidobacteria bacterium]|nr:GldG family protein [Acidobacteriota bacterium]
MMHRILGIVGWLGVALIFAATFVRFVRPEWDQYVIYGVRAGLVGVVLYTLGQWRDILAFFGTRNARHGAVAGAGVLITLGLLVAVNYLSTRRNTRWDLTENQQFSLSDQTLRLLQSLETPVTFLVFDQEGGFDRFRARLDEYAYQSDQVRVEYIDADRQPARARQYQVQAYGTVVIEHDDRVERVTSETEQDLTNGLIRVLSDAPRKVYFAQGHGERTTTDTERTGYSSLATLLSRDNYIVDLTTLAQQAEVPADASVVVLAGPKTDLLPGEADMLRRYLDTGGDLLVLLDPPESDGAAVRMPVLEALLQEWSIEVGNDVVVDASGVGQLIGTDASVPVAASYPVHPITDRFNVLTAYPFARSVNVAAEPAPGRTPQAIIETGPRSWA